MTDSNSDLGSAVTAKATEKATETALSLAKQVTQKLAFELPAPFGPGVAKALGLLFGLSAGGDADTLGAVQAMLSKAVGQRQHRPGDPRRPRDEQGP